MNEQEKNIFPISELHECTGYTYMQSGTCFRALKFIYTLTINYILDICNIIVCIIMHTTGPVRRFSMARPVNGNNIELYTLNKYMLNIYKS